MQRLLRGVLCSSQRSVQLLEIAAVDVRGFASASSQKVSIKALRERTNAPISDVKAALMEADWDQGRSGFDRIVL